MFVYVDIETLPEQDRGPASYMSEVKVPTNYKDEDLILRTRVEGALKMWEQTSLDPLRAQVFAVCVATDTEEPVVWMDTMGTPGGEAAVMAQLNAWYLDRFEDHPNAPAPIWCGHNAVRFDLPMLFLRAARLGQRRLAQCLRPRNGRYGDDNHKDTLVAIGGEGKLDEVARFFGVQRPTTIAGSAIREAFARQRFTEIRDHVIDDVLTVRFVAQKLREAGVL